MITLEDKGHRFNYRVAGIALHEGRVLLQSALGDSFWTLPGGRCELGECAEAALKREMQEELDSEVQVVRLLWVVENFFRYGGKPCDELALHFLMNLPDVANSPIHSDCVHLDEGGQKLTFGWFDSDYDSLSKLPLLPSFLPRTLQAIPASTQHILHYDR